MSCIGAQIQSSSSCFPLLQVSEFDWGPHSLARSPHPLSLHLSCPKAPEVFLEHHLPPSPQQLKKKKKNLSPLETLLHPNEAILWGFVMVRRPPFPLRENLFILCESSFPSFTRTFIFFRWNTAQVFLSLVSFHIPQISFKRRVASFLLSWKTRVLLRFMWTLIWMRSDTCWLVEINQPLISIPGHYNIWRCCLAYWGSIGLLRSYETALRGKDMSFMLLLVTDQQAAASSSHSNIWHIFFQQFKRTLWRKSEIDCDIGVVLDLNFSVSFDSDFVQLTEN